MSPLPLNIVIIYFKVSQEFSKLSEETVSCKRSVREKRGLNEPLREGRGLTRPVMWLIKVFPPVELIC